MTQNLFLTTTCSDNALAEGEFILKTQTKIQAQEWTQATNQMPEVPAISTNVHEW